MKDGACSFSCSAAAATTIEACSRGRIQPIKVHAEAVVKVPPLDPVSVMWDEIRSMPLVCCGRG